MVKEQERKDHRKRDPDGELLVNRHTGESIQKKKAGNRDGYGRCIIDINGPYEIALLPFELQAAVKTIVVHRERAPIQGAYIAARAPETKAGAEHR